MKREKVLEKNIKRTKGFLSPSLFFRIKGKIDNDEKNSFR